MGAVLAMPKQDERKSRRLPLTGGFEYEHSDGEHGEASWRSISLDGACVQIGRYLRPGRQMRVSYRGHDMIMRVVWCRATGDENFLAGVQVVNGGPELALVTLMAAARRLATRRKLN